MAAQAKLEHVEPPHEEEGTARFRGLYDGQEFVDDVTGLHLNKDLAVQARRVELLQGARGLHESPEGTFDASHYHEMA